MKMLAVAALAGALSLGACQTFPTDLNSVVALVQQDAQAACSFLPTVETVAAIVVTAIVPGGQPIEQVAQNIADQICGSVTKKSFVPGQAAHVTINGKTFEVKGKFVK